MGNLNTPFVCEPFVSCHKLFPIIPLREKNTSKISFFMQKTYFASEKSLLWLQKYFSKKFKLVIDISCIIPYNTSCCGNKEQRIGLSPNGKATDSDSVIFKVRILVAQLRALRSRCSFFVLVVEKNRERVGERYM